MIMIIMIMMMMIMMMMIMMMMIMMMMLRAGSRTPPCPSPSPSSPHTQAMERERERLQLLRKQQQQEEAGEGEGVGKDQTPGGQGGARVPNDTNKARKRRARGRNKKDPTTPQTPPAPRNPAAWWHATRALASEVMKGFAWLVDKAFGQLTGSSRGRGRGRGSLGSFPITSVAIALGAMLMIAVIQWGGSTDEGRANACRAAIRAAHAAQAPSTLAQALDGLRLDFTAFSSQDSTLLTDLIITAPTAMRQWPDSGPVAAASCRLLHHLTHPETFPAADTAAARLRDEGAWPLASKALHTFLDHEGVQEACLWALAYVARGAETGSSFLPSAATGGAAVEVDLAGALRRFPLAAGVQAAGSMLAYRLAHDPPMRATVWAAGVPALVVTALHHHPKDYPVQNLGTSALAQLLVGCRAQGVGPPGGEGEDLFDSQVQHILFLSLITRPFFQRLMLRRPPKLEPVVWARRVSHTRTLGSIMQAQTTSPRGPLLAALLSQVEGAVALRAVLGAMGRYPEQRQVQHSGCWALAMLAFCRKADGPLMAAEGAWTAIDAAMTAHRHPGQWSVQFTCCQAITFMAELDAAPVPPGVAGAVAAGLRAYPEVEHVQSRCLKAKSAIEGVV
jgi:hypothetical protein